MMSTPIRTAAISLSLLLGLPLGVPMPPSLALAPSARAAPRVETGAALAKHYCATCHVVVRSASQGWTNAPSFVSIANRHTSTVAGLSAFIQKPHMHMLNTRRPPGEADAIAAYIMSLRGQ